MKVKITSDSTCDLGKELIEKNGVGIFPLTVILGDESFADGEIEPAQIFEFVERTGTLPKTAAATEEEYAALFSASIEGYDSLVHISISSCASSTHSAAKAAAQRFNGRVRVVDSHALSSGQGLLVLRACDLANEGKTAEQIEELLNEVRTRVNTSFVPDALDYLHKGGRCSLAALIGAKVLKLHPLICENAEGQLIAKRKYMGNMERCIRSYINDLKNEYPDYDPARCFITHSSAEKPLVDLAKRLVSENFGFDEVIETIAGSIVTSHCGKGTLGVLFIYNK